MTPLNVFAILILVWSIDRHLNSNVDSGRAILDGTSDGLDRALVLILILQVALLFSVLVHIFT